MGKGIKEIYSDCDPTQADDKSLPSNSFLIEYEQLNSIIDKIFKLE